MILLKKIFRDLRTNRAANIAATVLISIALLIFTFGQIYLFTAK